MQRPPPLSFDDLAAQAKQPSEGLLQAGVIGWPISHSLSPLLHGFWLDLFGLPGRYDAVAIAPDQLEAAIPLLIANHFQGWNVTIPHKEAIAPFMDEIDPFAQKIGAINTVVIDYAAQGRFGPRLLGMNSDWVGFSRNVEDHPAWANHPRQQALMIGAGGAARAVALSLQQWGFGQVTVTNRNLARAEELVTSVVGGEEDATNFTVADWEGALSAKALAQYDMIINCTSLGMQGQAPLLLDCRDLQPNCLVTDLVYRPLVTPLLAAAAAQGCPTQDGLGMLLHQAVVGFEHWFRPPAAPPVDHRLRQHLLAAM